MKPKQDAVEVRVVYGSLFAHLAGTASEVLQLEKPTVDSLIQSLKKRHTREFGATLAGSGGEEILPGVAILVNSVSATPDTALKQGDEVAILLAFQGG